MRLVRIFRNPKLHEEVIVVKNIGLKSESHAFS